MDDILSGEATIKDAKKLQAQICELFLRAGFELHERVSNSPDLLQDLSTSSYSFDKGHDVGPVKTLGMLWDPKVDCLTYEVKIKDKDSFLKREVFSEIARLFDPLGLIGPIITKAKIFIQGLWKIKLDWSEQLPPDAKKEWKKFYLKLSEQVCSGSVENTYRTQVGTVCRVTVIEISLKVVPILQLPIDEISLWTDSTIVLAWIKTEPHKLKTFVSNRVAEIQTLTEDCHWKHICSKKNPADLISRGCHADELLKNDMWFSGPDLQTDELEDNQFIPDPTYVDELKCAGL
ncbi:hypothetical protein AVEN_146300-1 [Araneus ventricosus]|uniref:Peptidase aspartic putative domain-containing protein n=1 Tax=Araneus ventricosus TaxID=182803 RepID=A0A4Y2HZU1_ARAVE|nr:hypothetical protein AVEN_146300-1 [Araneus ventricosus]